MGGKGRGFNRRGSMLTQRAVPQATSQTIALVKRWAWYFMLGYDSIAAGPLVGFLNPDRALVIPYTPIRNVFISVGLIHSEY